VTRLPWDRAKTGAQRVDRQGELYFSPPGLTYVWAVLVLLTALEAANELFGIGGPSSLYELWFHDIVLASTAALVLARAAYEPTARKAWLAFGLAMACWAAGSILWSAVYGGQSTVPYPTFADVLWLLWYPLMALGITRLIQVRIPRFDLYRWLDGVAVTLVVLVAGFALVVEPVADQATQGNLATFVDFSYPVLDMLLIGAVLGVYGLLGWRPDRMWLLIGFGTLMTTIADASFAVQEARGVAEDNHYDFVWTLGALLVAYAAWVRVPGVTRNPKRVTGMRAIALPLIAQALAAGIQIYAIFEPVGKSERVVTLIVLVVASVQIIITRPRAQSGDDGQAVSGTVEEDTPATQDGLSRSDTPRSG
jgi:diguanylate cyclase